MQLLWCEAYHFQVNRGDALNSRLLLTSKEAELADMQIGVTALPTAATALYQHDALAVSCGKTTTGEGCEHDSMMRFRSN
jgi:hypothetical protein